MKVWTIMLRSHAAFYLDCREDLREIIGVASDEQAAEAMVERDAREKGATSVRLDAASIDLDWRTSHLYISYTTLLAEKNPCQGEFGHLNDEDWVYELREWDLIG